MKHTRQWQRHHYSHRIGGALLMPWTNSHLLASSAPELHSLTVAAHAALDSTSRATGSLGRTGRTRRRAGIGCGGGGPSGDARRREGRGGTEGRGGSSGAEREGEEGEGRWKGRGKGRRRAGGQARVRPAAGLRREEGGSGFCAAGRRPALNPDGRVPLPTGDSGPGESLPLHQGNGPGRLGPAGPGPAHPRG